MKVLIADDNEINRRFLRGVLEPESIQVMEANDGEQAVELCASHRFDLIFMDIRMPGMDGMAATEAIRSAPGFDPDQTRIVALTADLRVRQKDDLLRQGFSHCLTKPVDRKTVLAMLGDPEPPMVEAPEDHGPPLIDQEAALAAAGGNQELLDRLSGMLEMELARFLPLIDQSLEADRRDEARDMVHKVRGSAGYCGARVLQSAAEQLETALSDGGSSALETHLEIFRRAARDTIGALKS